MKNSDIQFLKSKIDGDPIKICCIDGEKIMAKILSVSESTGDIICDIISTDRPEKYVDKNAAILIHFNEIQSVIA